MSEVELTEGEIGMVIASQGTDLGWFAAFGLCGHCGDDPDVCSCEGECGCWPHDHEIIGPFAVYETRS